MMKVCALLGIVAAIAGGFTRYEMWAAESGWAQEPPSPTGRFLYRLTGFGAQDGKAQRVEAPELDGAVGWLNTEKAVTLKDLRGKIVLLDFWTYC